MRGLQTLYTNLLPQSVKIESTRKGQRNVHLSRRDDALAYRYYFHAQILRRRYDDCLASLEEEFFITSLVIVQRLNDRQPLLKELVAKKTDTTTLKKAFPQFSWQSN